MKADPEVMATSRLAGDQPPFLRLGRTPRERAHHEAENPEIWAPPIQATVPAGGQHSVAGSDDAARTARTAPATTGAERTARTGNARPAATPARTAATRSSARRGECGRPQQAGGRNGETNGHDDANQCPTQLPLPCHHHCLPPKFKHTALRRSTVHKLPAVSTASARVTAPVVDIAATPDGKATGR